MSAARIDCLGNRRHKARCTRCSSRSGPFAERTSECGCAVLYCDACREDPGFEVPGMPDARRRCSAEEWLRAYAGMHAWRFVAERAVDPAGASGCGDCACTPPEALVSAAAAERRVWIDGLRGAFLSDPGCEVRYPEGDDVPAGWRREAAERSMSMVRMRSAAGAEAEEETA